MKTKNNDHLHARTVGGLFARAIVCFAILALLGSHTAVAQFSKKSQKEQAVQPSIKMTEGLCVHIRCKDVAKTMAHLVLDDGQIAMVLAKDRLFVVADRQLSVYEISNWEASRKTKRLHAC